jgi:hypothetical protein
MSKTYNDETYNNKQLLKEFIHFIISNYGNEGKFTSSVRMQKVVLYSNVYYAKKNKDPLFDITYVKKPQGPFSYDVKNALEELEKESKIEIKKERTKRRASKGTKVKDVDQVVYTSLKMFNPPIEHQKVFESLYPVIRKIVDKNSGQVSRYSHQKGEGHGEIWQVAEMDEELPFRLYLFEDDKEPSEDDFDWARKILDKSFNTQDSH